MATKTKPRDVLMWQICTGCALTREVRVTQKEGQRLQDLPLSDCEKHADCYPLGHAKPGVWVTNGGRWAPVDRGRSRE